MTIAELAVIFLSGLCILLLFWGVGQVTLSFLRIGEWLNSFQRLAMSLICGPLICIILYSLALANHFNSISIVIFFIFLVWLVLRIKIVKPLPFRNLPAAMKASLKLNEVVVFAAAYLLIFAVQLIKSDVLSGNVPTGSLDFPFYITVAEELNLQGIENTLSYINQIQGVSVSSAQPYHFFDLWMNAFLQRITFANPLCVFLFLFIPLFAFLSFGAIVFIGSWFSARQEPGTHKKITNWHIALVALVPVFLIGYIPYSKVGLNGFGWLETPIINNYKLFYSYLLIGCGVPLLMRKSYATLVLLFFVSAYCYILYLPIIALAFFAMVLMDWNEAKKNKPAVVLFILGVALFATFYTLQPREAVLTSFARISLVDYLREMIFNFSSISSIAHFIRAYAVQVFYFGPFLILLAWQLKSGIWREYKILATFATIILIGALLSYVFLSHIEGWQFLIQCYGPALYTLFCLLILQAFQREGGYIKKVLLVLVASQMALSVIITLEVTSEYAPAVSAEFKNQLEENARDFSKLGLYCISHTSAEGNSRNVSPYLNYYTGFIKILPGRWLIQASDISSENLDKISPEFKSLYMTSPIYQFIHTRQLPFEEGVREFIKENKISFIVWSKAGDVAYLDDLMERTITDSRSGFSVSFLKKQN